MPLLKYMDWENFRDKIYYLPSLDARREIAFGLGERIRLTRKKIDRIDNDPNNEGQADYIERKSELLRLIEELEEIRKEFSGTN